MGTLAHCCRAIGVGAALGVALVAVLFRLSESFDSNLIGF